MCVSTSSLRPATGLLHTDGGVVSVSSCSATDDCLLASSTCAVGSWKGLALLLLSRLHVRFRSQAHCARRKSRGAVSRQTTCRGGAFKGGSTRPT